MANFKYFSNFQDGSYELSTTSTIDNKEFAKRFPGIVGIRSDGYQKRVGWEKGNPNMLPLTRMIEYKTHPSHHECNAKCLNGKSTGVCECKCGGKNHGRGNFL